MSKRYDVKYPLLLSDFNETEFSGQISQKKLIYQVLSKSVQWEPSCSMRLDGLMTDMTKVIVAFRSFANVPKNQVLL